MSPRLQAEIDKGLEKVRKQEFDQAANILTKPKKWRPGIPTSNISRMLEYQQSHYEQARANLKRTFDLSHSRARPGVAGELQLRAGQSDKAVQRWRKPFR